MVQEATMNINLFQLFVGIVAILVSMYLMKDVHVRYKMDRISFLSFRAQRFLLHCTFLYGSTVGVSSMLGMM